VNPLRVFVGYDPREAEAYRVAESSLRQHASVPVDVMPLDAERLAACGLLRRPQDRRGYTYDIHSNAPQSTDFAISRFLVPHLAQQGWALFVDCDVAFLADVAELFDQADPDKAVMVVKHQQGGGGTKMDGQQQTTYPRKNWSSVVLWNCEHPANRRLSLQDVNERPGRDLHAFYWLADSEIGSLSRDWNWLVGVQPKPLFPKLAHYTLGGPFTPGWKGGEHDDLWNSYAYRRTNAA
jgi:lipopolysaccharide biosynthesis glycosyltransferase